MISENARFQQLQHWLENDLQLKGWDITPASADASFRQYYRIQSGDQSFVIMDAPPEHEDVKPFLDITGRLAAEDVLVPYVHAKSIDQGFLLLDDLGSRPYLEALHASTVNSLYSDALRCLSNIQRADTEGLPSYSSELLHTEVELFREWFLEKHLGLTLSDEQNKILDSCFSELTASALEQPTVFVHRDFHSRNLMVLQHDNPGVIDYQDAVLGPVTYDQASLLRDCYISWPKAQVEDWLLSHRDALQTLGQIDPIDSPTYLRWFDLMGIQRHLKAIGIFARLNHRDGKPGYLNDIPRTLAYILHIAPEHPEIRPLATLIIDLGITQMLTQ